MNSLAVYAIIRNQLPSGVDQRIGSITIKSDPYHLATKASLIAADGRVFETSLLPDHQGHANKLPDQFIAHLCVAL